MKNKPTGRITELLIELWRWIIEHYGCTVDDICELRGIKKRAAYDLMQKWIDDGYFYRKEKSGGIILPKQRTYRECGVPYKFHDIGLVFLIHAAAVTKVEHWLRKREDMIVMSWTGERYLRHMRGMDDTLESWRVTTHVPDAVAEIYSRKTQRIEEVAIEAERTAKGREEWYKILTLNASQYEHIWYFADMAQVYHPLETCIENLPDEDIKKFHLWKLDTIVCERKTQFTPDITQI